MNINLYIGFEYLVNLLYYLSVIKVTDTNTVRTFGTHNNSHTAGIVFMVNTYSCNLYLSHLFFWTIKPAGSETFITVGINIVAQHNFALFILILAGVSKTKNQTKGYNR